MFLLCRSGRFFIKNDQIAPSSHRYRCKTLFQFREVPKVFSKKPMLARLRASAVDKSSFFNTKSSFVRGKSSSFREIVIFQGKFSIIPAFSIEALREHH